MGCTDAQKIELTVYELDGEVDHWWKVIEDSKTSEQHRAMTWDQFKVLFFECYFFRSVKGQMYCDFLNLRQEDNESVAEYGVQVLFVRGATSDMVVRVAIGIRERVSGVAKRVIISEIVLLQHQDNLAHKTKDTAMHFYKGADGCESEP
ncbi:hypothetical protein RJ639_016971 [Escallonia herrerae]|uniref:Retrotransposon gag domain-containing protein n=1 Tax=Escallonia herrerae TaxID=1293975 RepID=A0AA88VCR9_9ASTE|nr:hypothetical protein RJ639_016971 [Escallonia herrerae]